MGREVALKAGFERGPGSQCGERNVYRQPRPGSARYA